MELQKQNNQSLSKTSETALQVSKKISESNEEEIKQALRYIISLIGVPVDKIPVGASKDMMVSYIKQNWANSELNEMREAFNSAVENLFIDLTLYDRIFNIEYIKSVIKAYRNYKHSRPKPITGMNNTSMAIAILQILKEKAPETLEKLKSMGEKKEIEKPKARERTENEKMVDGWINQFDKKCNEKRLFFRGGTGMTINDFLNYKLKQREIVIKYLNK